MARTQEDQTEAAGKRYPQLATLTDIADDPRMVKARQKVEGLQLQLDGIVKTLLETDKTKVAGSGQTENDVKHILQGVPADQLGGWPTSISLHRQREAVEGALAATREEWRAAEGDCLRDFIALPAAEEAAIKAVTKVIEAFHGAEAAIEELDSLLVLFRSKGVRRDRLPLGWRVWEYEQSFSRSIGGYWSGAREHQDGGAAAGRSRVRQSRRDSLPAPGQVTRCPARGTGARAEDHRNL